MEPINTPLTQNLRHIHRIITQAIQLDTTRGIDYLNSGFRGEQDLHSYVRFNRCLMAFLCSHRQAEELVAFPAFRKLMSLAPFGQLNAEHHELESLCALIPEVMTDISSGNPNYGLRVLLILLRKFGRSWTTHMQVEESYFCDEMITPEMNEEIQSEIDGTIRTLRKERTRSLYWEIPFLLYEVDQRDLFAMEANFPNLMKDELVHKGQREELSLQHFYMMN